MFTRRVAEEDAILPSLLLMGTAAQDRLAFQGQAVPIVRVGAMAALILSNRHLNLFLPAAHNLLCQLESVQLILFGNLLHRCINVI